MRPRGALALVAQENYVAFQNNRALSWGASHRVHERPPHKQQPLPRCLDHLLSLLIGAIAIDTTAEEVTPAGIAHWFRTTAGAGAPAAR